MIVICDFLLLSLLSLANFDSPATDKKAEEEKQQAIQNQSFVDSQMVELLKMSLDSERDRRMTINADVEKLVQTAEKNKQLADKQREILKARETELKSLAKTKSDLESERDSILKKSSELQARVNSAEKRNAKLQEEILSASEKLEKSANERIALERKIGDMREIDSASRSKLESVQRELRQNKQRLEQLQIESESLKNENRAIESEKQALATRLEIAATKTQIYEENIKRYQTLINIEKTEKEKIREHAENLAVGVGELAVQQEKINKNVETLRQKTATEIFNEIKSTFVKVSFSYTNKGLFGDGKSTRELNVLPIEIAGSYWLIVNADDTIIAPTLHQYYPPDSLEISISGKNNKEYSNAVFAVAEDPRLLALPISKKFVDSEKIKPLRKPDNFFTYPECVVINPKKFYYGTIPFRADFKNPLYAKLDTSLIESIFGEFSPSEGDFIISKNGDILGLMLDSSIAILLKKMTPYNALRLGNNYNKRAAAEFVKINSDKLKNSPAN